LARVWQEYKQSLSRNDLANELVDALSRLGPAARTFIDETGSTLTRLNQALESVQSGPDYQTTKLQVMHTNISHRLRPVIDTRDLLVSGAERLWLSRNVELASLANRVSSMKTQIDAHRAEIENALRAKTVAELQLAFENQARQLQKQRDLLREKLAEQDRAIWDMAGEALGMLAENGGGDPEQFMDLIQWHRQHGDELNTLLAEQDAGETAAAAVVEVPEVMYLSPTSAGPAINERLRMRNAFLAGAGPLALYLSLWLLTALWSAVTRPRRAAQQASLALAGAPSGNPYGDSMTELDDG
jgi:hypothetical protein